MQGLTKKEIQLLQVNNNKELMNPLLNFNLIFQHLQIVVAVKIRMKIFQMTLIDKSILVERLKHKKNNQFQT